MRAEAEYMTEIRPVGMVHEALNQLCASREKGFLSLFGNDMP